MIKYRVCIIGAGKVGTALAKHFYSCGIQIDQVVDTKLTNARILASRVKAKSFSSDLLLIPQTANLICISVQDRNIKSVVNNLVDGKNKFSSVYIFHTSGSETSEVLYPLKKLGAQILSFHPLFSFASKKIEYDLSNVFFAIESDSKIAINYAQRFCKDIKAKSIVIGKNQKGLYHAFAVFISNYLTVLLARAEKSLLGKKSKIKINNLYKPLIDSTLRNIEILGVREGLTGPAKRGDRETIKNNIEALQKYSPELTKSYKEFARIIKGHF